MLDPLLQSARNGDVAAVRHDLGRLSEADRRQLAPKALKLMQEVRQAYVGRIREQPWPYAGEVESVHFVWGGHIRRQHIKPRSRVGGEYAKAGGARASAEERRQSRSSSCAFREAQRSLQGRYCTQQRWHLEAWRAAVDQR